MNDSINLQDLTTPTLPKSGREYIVTPMGVPERGNPESLRRYNSSGGTMSIRYASRNRHIIHSRTVAAPRREKVGRGRRAMAATASL